jgi:hypothetical protein
MVSVRRSAFCIVELPGPHFYWYRLIVITALCSKCEKASCCGGCEDTLSDFIILTGNRVKLLKFSYDH